MLFTPSLPKADTPARSEASGPISIVCPGTLATVWSGIGYSGLASGRNFRIGLRSGLPASPTDNILDDRITGVCPVVNTFMNAPNPAGGGQIRPSTPSLRNLPSVVSPSDVEVSQPLSRRTVTLITCFPFYYIGPAPKRFVVRVCQAGPSPEPALSASRG